MPTISVVIPLYNKKQYIKRAIDSVLAQTVQEFEIIVVNDGSTDNGADVVRSIPDDRIRLIEQENKGVSVARNRGIETSQSELVAFLDADDEYKSHFLATVLRLKERFPASGAYATAYEIKEPNGKTKKQVYKAIPPHPWEGVIPNYFKSALGVHLVCSSSVAVVKAVFKKAGLFPSGEKFGEDLDEWIRIAIDYPIAFSTEINSIYHQDANNRVLLDIIHPEKYIFDRNYGMYHNKLILNNKYVESKYLKEFVNKFRLKYAIALILEGKKAKALEYLLKIKTRYFLPRLIKYLILILLPKKLLYAFLKIRNSNC